MIEFTLKTLSCIINIDINVYSKCKFEADDGRKICCGTSRNVHSSDKKFTRFFDNLFCNSIEAEHLSLGCSIRCIKN
jgi:hypothetical protein